MFDPAIIDSPHPLALSDRIGRHGRLLTGDTCLDRVRREARVRERVAELTSQGLRSGQVVLCPDIPVLELVLMALALRRVGAALLPYRTGTDPSDLDRLAAATGAEWRWCPENATLVGTGMTSPCQAPVDSALASLVKTSGSSGGPKVVMLTRENLRSSAAAVNRRIGFGSEDVWLCCLRLSHIGGLAIIDRWELAGATLILHERFDAQALADDLHRHGVTHVSFVPPMLDRLLETGVAPPPTLRVVLVGGQKLSDVLAERAIAAGWPLFLTYGMTETSSQIATSASALDRVPEEGRVGPLLPGVEIESLASPTGLQRLRVRGPMVMAGYANPSRIPGDGLDDGWFETSDLVIPGDDGEPRILGRSDDVLVVGGCNVSLVRVAALLRRAPGVAEAIVVGLEDPVWGHRLVAVYRGALDEQALGRWCEGALSGAERPRAFRCVAEFPLLESGKYDRIGIRALALESHPP